MQPTTDSQRETLEEAVTSYQQAVSPAVARYLLERGIEEQAAATFRLGVVEDPAPGHDRFRGMLAIPYLHRSGYPLTIRFRCLRDQEHDCRDYFHGKYNGLKDEPTRIFNTTALFQAESEIHVTEGELDAIILNQIGLPAIAVPGAHNWKYHYTVVLAGYSRVWVWGDDDEAGHEFVGKVTRACRQARGVRIKGGDVTDLYLRGGASALLDLITWENR